MQLAGDITREPYLRLPMGLSRETGRSRSISNHWGHYPNLVTGPYLGF